jgi:hypothetical protein
MSNVMDEINKLYWECTDPNRDGFTAFEKKKQLLLAKWKIEKYLPQCPCYQGEEEWIKENCECDNG